MMEEIKKITESEPAAAEDVQAAETETTAAEAEAEQETAADTAEISEAAPEQPEEASTETAEAETPEDEEAPAAPDEEVPARTEEAPAEGNDAESAPEEPREIQSGVDTAADYQAAEQTGEEAAESGKTSGMKKKIISIAVTCALVVALLLCVSVIAQVLSKGYVSIGNYSLFRVITGSMEPEIPVGSLLVSRKVDIADIEVGDIVNYRSKESGMFGVIITHRVIQTYEGLDGEIFLETKGDANQYADAYFVDQDYLIGQTVYYTKEGNLFAGVLSFLTGKVGFLACIVIPCLLIGGLTMRDCVKSLREEMDAITKQLDAVEATVNNNSLERQLGEDAYQELCDRLRGELLEELKQGAETNNSTEQPGADHQ